MAGLLKNILTSPLERIITGYLDEILRINIECGGVLLKKVRLSGN
jgi:hypothetical protein